MTPAQFFFEHAGYSYDPKKESQTEGRRRCAKELAKAEHNGSALGYSFEWSLDGSTNREWTKQGEEYATWQCVCRDATGEILSSLCGIDFGDGGEPWGDPYRRVVEAELAQEAGATSDIEQPAKEPVRLDLAGDTIGGLYEHHLRLRETEPAFPETEPALRDTNQP